MSKDWAREKLEWQVKNLNKQCEGEAGEKRKLAGVKRISQCENGGNGALDGHRARDS